MEEIEALIGMSDREEAKELLTAYRATVSAARLAYNRVTNADQLAFIKNAGLLPEAEAAVRAVRKAFGETVSITELRIKTPPAKLTYVDGELFDATGMVVTIVYDDGSQDDVSSGFVLPTEPLYAGQQMVTFYYEGIAKTISVTVNRSGNTTDPGKNPGDDRPETPDDPGMEDEEFEVPYLLLGIIGGLVVLFGLIAIITGARASAARRAARKRRRLK